MTEQQQKIQNLLDEFIGRNVSEIERVSKENPLLLKSVLDVVSVISKKYGEGKAAEVKIEEPVEEKSEEKRLFRVGDYFYHKDHKGELHKIVGLTTSDEVEVMTSIAKTVSYTLSEVNQYFKEGTWVNIGDPYKKGYFEKKPQVETVTEIKQEQQEQAEQLSAEDIKAAIKNLKPLAEFDEDVQKEIERLKQQLKSLKSKKS